MFRSTRQRHSLSTALIAKLLTIYIWFKDLNVPNFGKKCMANILNFANNTTVMQNKWEIDNNIMTFIIF